MPIDDRSRQSLALFVSWLVSKCKVESEIRKLWYELQHSYAEQLHEARKKTTSLLTSHSLFLSLSRAT